MDRIGAELIAPPHWGSVEFISDLHLHPQDPATFQAWAHYLRNTTADAVFILGDLFEVWVGDDVLEHPSSNTSPASFEQACAQALHQAAAHTRLFLMHGNRDFLLGQRMARACGATLLDDPSVLEFGQVRWLLTHGDALCLGDVEYQAFRATVRSTAWQQQFLAQPLDQRQHQAQALRAQSQAHQHTMPVYADADPTATLAQMQALNVMHTIHGHTHRPALHDLGHGHRRIVLSDWDCQAQPPRAEVLRLEKRPHAALQVQRLPWSLGAQWGAGVTLKLG